MWGVAPVPSQTRQSQRGGVKRTPGLHPHTWVEAKSGPAPAMGVLSPSVPSERGAGTPNWEELVDKLEPRAQSGSELGGVSIDLSLLGEPSVGRGAPRLVAAAAPGRGRGAGVQGK